MGWQPPTKGACLPAYLKLANTASLTSLSSNLAAGSTLGPGAGWTFAAQTSGSGTAHPTAGDTFTVTCTTGGTTFTQTGHF